MTLFRWLIGMPAAALVTAALFFMMAEMIRNKHVDYPEPTAKPDLQITAELKPEPRGPVKPVRPVLPKDPPEPIINETTRGELPTHTVDLPEPGHVDVGPGNGAMPTGGASIKVTPPYPENCRSKGVEGLVVVEFDVTPEGNVANVRVTHSPDRCFDRPIRNAVSKWKYPPASTNGRAAMRYGVVETFNFQLVD